jgi:hypothetical protein
VDAADDAAEVADYRRGLQETLRFLLEEQDIEHDEEDLAETEETLAALRKIAGEKWGGTAPGRESTVPDGGKAFDGIVLRWGRKDFPAIRSRWPESTAKYGDDYQRYATLLQQEARTYDDAGAARVRIVSGDLADYEAYARREGRDPGDQSTRRDYGEWCVTAHPGRVQLWPPARNSVCWCDSGRKYKKCCGAPARS